MNIRARAILLDQYESGVHSVDKALQRVVAELGSNSMDKKEALYWWRRFVNEDFDISYGASKAECALLKNGTFLRASQALFQSDSSPGFYIPCKMSGVDDRFYIGITSSNFVVDTFYGINRNIILDCSEIPTTDMDAVTVARLKLTFLHFLSEDRVLGIGDTRVFAIKIFCGTFNFSSCVLKIERVVTLNGWWSAHYLMLNSTTQQPSIMWRPEGSSRMHYTAININDRDLSLDAIMEVPTAINFPMMLDDKIFGFSGDDRVNTQQLVEFFLTTRTKTVYKVETDGSTEDCVSPDSPYTWKGKKLWVARYNCKFLTTTVIEFDLQTMKWQETKFEVPGKVRMLTLFNNSLVLNSFICTGNTGCNGVCYRFLVGRCDTLSSSVLNSIRRYSQVHPQFNRWMASKLPSSSRHYLPLWD